MKPTDPIESIIAESLRMACIEFVHESQNKQQNLDFYLPEFDCYIECKAFSTDRTEKQIKDKNVILIQGKNAAKAFRYMLFGE